MKTKYYVKSQADVPTEQHWAILTFSGVSTPGYDVGDASYVVKIVEYTAFTNEEEWEQEIKLLEERHIRTSYSAIRVTPAVVSKSINISWL